MSDERRQTTVEEDGERPVAAFYRLTDMKGRVEPPRHYRGPEVEIEFGLFFKGGRGTAGEIVVAWERMGPDRELTPRLHAYGDSFAALWQLRRVLRELSTRPGVTPDQFCALLLRLGFTDFTLSDTPWLAYKPTGSFYGIRDGIFVAAPMSADESVTQPYEEDVAEVDYDAVASFGGTDMVDIRAIEVALRSGATSLDDLSPYRTKGVGHVAAATTKRGLR